MGETMTSQTKRQINKIRKQLAILTPKAETGEQHAELCRLYGELEKLGDPWVMVR
jgi:hypothetical protein